MDKQMGFLAIREHNMSIGRSTETTEISLQFNAEIQAVRIYIPKLAQDVIMERSVMESALRICNLEHIIGDSLEATCNNFVRANMSSDKIAGIMVVMLFLTARANSQAT